MEPNTDAESYQDPEADRKRKLKVLRSFVITIGIILLAYGVYAAYSALRFHIVSTNPATSNMTTVSSLFTVNFNKPLSNNLEVTSNPSIIESYRVSGKAVNFTLSIPFNAKPYTITFRHISDTAGDTILNKTLSFTPTLVDSQSLPKQQQQALLKQQTDYNNTIESNKLLQLLPFTGPGFEYSVSYTVQYKNQKDIPVIEITAPTKQAQQAGLAWVESQGGNPSKLNIQYITAQP